MPESGSPIPNGRGDLPKGLRAAQGYLELATCPATKLGLDPRLRRRILFRSLRLSRETVVDDSDRSMRHLLMGQALRFLARYERAFGFLKKASFDPRLRRDAMLASAWCEKRVGRLDRSIATVTRALALVPDDATLHYNLACYLALSQHTQAALYELAWAIELRPGLRRPAVTEPDFENLRPYFAFAGLTEPPRRVKQLPTHS